MAQEDPAVRLAEDDAAARCQDMDQPQRRPMQFSLRTIFIATIVWSAACAGLFAGPVWAVVLTGYCLLLATPVTLTMVAIYGGGYRRTFCIGAMFPAGMLLLSGGQTGLALLTYRMGGMSASFAASDRLVIGITVGAAMAAVLGCGLLAVGVRRLVEAEKDSQPSHAVGREESQP